MDSSLTTFVKCIHGSTIQIKEASGEIQPKKGLKGLLCRKPSSAYKTIKTTSKFSKVTRYKINTLISDF